MGILDRLGNLLKSYLDDGGGFFRGGRAGGGPREDPDMRAAREELEDFLRGEKARGSGPGEGDWSGAGGRGAGHRGAGEDWSDPRGFRREGAGGEAPRGGGDWSGQGGGGGIPGSVRAAFAELGLEPGAPEEECKAAYKRLLKLHHPDRHGGHPGNTRKATEKTSRLNAAYDRIEGWRKTGRAD
jgi:DnaJ-domain-containing protein 1